MWSHLFSRVFRVCPRTGQVVGIRAKAWWLAPFVGLAALVWFLARVLPKPDRATYPCQRASLSLAAGFVTWLLGTLGILAASRWIRGRVRKYRRAVLATGLAASAALVLWMSLGLPHPLASAWTPTDPANSPMGTARGLYPGRVVWVRDAAATPWDGASGNWWSDAGTSQPVVDSMLSRSLRSLTGASTDAAAWDALFRHSNNARGRGNVGYQTGEKIAIKINCNNTSGYTDTDNQADASPHTVLALLRQLVDQAGVPQDMITVYEAPNTAPSRVIPDRIYNKGHGEFANVVWSDCSGNGTNGRAAIAWTNNAITYSVSNGCGNNLPTCVTGADYLVNMSLLKGHNTAGVTLTAKNHYGSINTREHTFIRSSVSGMGAYSPFVDMIGHNHLGAKTLLFMTDGLYGVRDVGDSVPTYGRWNALFGGQWSASLFLSLDPVAIDSVGFDFVNAEFPTSAIVNADNYLHEAALANDPPSNTDYKPNGTTLSSLGVHEHWNNAVAKKYTRNLGTGSGIELVALLPEGESIPLPWRHQDVGAVGLPGGAALAGGTFSLSASGADIWGTADEFHFLYQPLEGDGSITLRVASLDNTDPWAKAGVMIRETLNPGSPNAAVFLTPANGVSFQWRATQGGTSSSASGGAASAPYWVRLERMGNVFSGYMSPDGVTWTLIGSQTIAMASAVYVGLAATSHNDAALNAAVTDSLSGTGGWDPSAGLAAGGDDGHKRCGLLGLELMAPLALAWLLRRRARSRAPRGGR